MNLWLRDVEPQLVSIDTWNAESNDHMIGVNELLGYRVMGREIEYQTSRSVSRPWAGLDRAGPRTRRTRRGSAH